MSSQIIGKQTPVLFKVTECSKCGYTWEPVLPPYPDLVENSRGVYIRCKSRDCNHINWCEKKQNHE